MLLLANTVIVTAGNIIEKQPFLAISFQGSCIDSQTLRDRIWQRIKDSIALARVDTSQLSKSDKIELLH
jgi:hypothetical protein